MSFFFAFFKLNRWKIFWGGNKLVKHEEKEVSLAEIWLNSLASVVNSQESSEHRPRSVNNVTLSIFTSSQRRELAER